MIRSNGTQSTLFVLASAFILACSKDEKAGGDQARSSTLGKPGVFTTPAANPASIHIETDSERTDWAVLAEDGGTVSATGADGTTFILTIPKGALLGPEQITLAPVASLTGLPAGASSVAAAQLGPDGLLLEEPATLEIKPPKPVDRHTAFPIAWNASGEDVHLHPLIPRSGAIRFQVSHFSGLAIASGSDAAMNDILNNEPQECGDRYFREVAEALATKRREALMGEEGGMSEIVDRFVELSKSYFAEAIQPLLAEVSKDDALLPCMKAEIATFERTFGLLAGDSLKQALFGKPLEDAWVEIYKASALAFDRAAERCRRNESPIFQLELMASISNFMTTAGLDEIMPPNAGASLVECSRSLEFEVEFESSIENTYRLQGLGLDFTSSKTTVKANQIRVAYNEKVSQRGTPTFMSLKKAPLDAAVTAVPRNPCPDKVRVQPGSYVEVTITPILNARAGKLICGGGKIRCESTDLNPGVMVQLAPNVVEEMFMHTKTSSACMPPDGWNESMMLFEGSQSTGAFEPFQVRGDQVAVTIVRRGIGKRGYVDLPAIERSLARTRASVKVVRLPGPP